MLHIKRLFKLSFVITLLAIICYIALWISSAYLIKHSVAEHVAKQNEHLKISYDKLSLSGFPLKIKLKFNNLSVKFESEDKKISSNSTYETVKVETNLLFNSIKFAITGKDTSDISLNGKLSALDTIYKEGLHITLIDSNPINTVKILNALYKEEAVSDFKIKEFSLLANNLVNIDRSNQKEISNGSTSIQVIIDRPSDIIANTSVKMDTKIDFFPGYKESLQNLIGFSFPFNKLAINTDVNYTSKKQDDHSSIPFVDIKSLNFGLDDTLFAFNGLIQDDKDGKTIFNVDLKASELNKLLENLMMQNILSKERYSVILALITDITGNDFPSNVIDFKISNEKGEVTIGKRSVFSLMDRVQQFIKSK